MKRRTFRMSFSVIALLTLPILGMSQSTGQNNDKTNHRGLQRKPDSQAALAQDVTIYRDTYGVPHVFGRTDASTMFGFAYAQAEDNFWRVEENFILALGRGAEVNGAEALNEDRRNHALEIP